MTLLFLLIALLPIIALWVIFTKAGRPGWAAIIPIYNFIVLLGIAGKPVWWIILFMIPVVNIVFLFLTLLSLASSFGKGVGFAIGLLLLPFVFYLLLAFGPAQYVQPAIEEA